MYEECKLAYALNLMNTVLHKLDAQFGHFKLSKLGIQLMYLCPVDYQLNIIRSFTGFKLRDQKIEFFSVSVGLVVLL